MISIGIDLILGVMLICALVLGVRLERRLTALKQSHLDFAKAVSELDQASVRTEQSLAALRSGSEAARTDLGARIDQARIACQRLEQLTAAAEKALHAQPLTLRQPLVAATPAPQLVAVEPMPLRTVQPATRSRARVDDDLFDTGSGREVRLTAGGRW
jgi:hypothetical protein